MEITTKLVQELVRDIELDPGTWLRIQDWLTKKFDHGRISLRLFGSWPYVLELDASSQQKGNLDKLTWRQAWLLRAAKTRWLAHKHGGIQKALADWHRNPDVPMAKWIELREQELKTKETRRDEPRR